MIYYNFYYKIGQMSLVVRSEFETFSPVWYEKGTYRSIGGVQTVLSEE